MDELTKPKAHKHTQVKLNQANLELLPDAVKKPSYDRSKLTPGIIHIGLGNFHRAHQAWFLHRLMEQGLAHDWAILGAGVRPEDAVMRKRLLDQDCLTTLVELDPSGTSAEVIGSMIDFIPVEEDNSSLIKAMSDPTIRIVSLTVTEGGYYLDGNGRLDVAHPDIQYDAANPEAPRTAFGAMVAALKSRKQLGHPAFAGQCCDNLQANGSVLRGAVVGLANLSDPELADWIDNEASFPDSMVDCIVPSTGEKELSLVQSLGIEDAAPVTHETFRQWVIQDQFCSGRPAWENAGATITEDVHAYEAMKIRVLNAGHQVLANVGEILGLPTISACMNDSQVAAFFHKVQTEEILPYVKAVPEMSTLDYLSLVERRFANPEILDTTRRVAFDGSSRHTGFVVPILRDALAKNGPVSGLALTEALWAKMCAGTREDGSEIEPNDPNWTSLNRVANAAKSSPNLWIEQQYYGSVADDPVFASEFANWLRMVWAMGARSTLETYLDD